MSGVEWGEPILVNGIKPSWLRKEEGLFENGPGDWIGGNGESLKGWSWHDGHDPFPINIRLPATHPFYTVQSHNAKHSTNFTYWPGGDCAPEDWDKGVVLTDSGSATHITAQNWSHESGMKASGSRAIGYTRRPTVTEDTVTIKRMTEAELHEAALNVAYDSRHGWRQAHRDLGLVREPTQAERIAAKVGLSVDQVEAVLGEVD